MYIRRPCLRLHPVTSPLTRPTRSLFLGYRLAHTYVACTLSSPRVYSVSYEAGPNVPPPPCVRVRQSPIDGARVPLSSRDGECENCALWDSQRAVKYIFVMIDSATHLGKRIKLILTVGGCLLLRCINNFHKLCLTMLCLLQHSV